MPYCGVAVVEALCGSSSGVEDPYLTEVRNWAYQGLQGHQRVVIDAVAGIHELSDNATDAACPEGGKRRKIEAGSSDTDAEAEAISKVIEMLIKPLTTNNKKNILKTLHDTL